MSQRLCAATLERLPAEVRRPTYNRGKLGSGVVHIGLGAFQRAHQAPLFERLVNEGDLGWGIIGASLRSPAIGSALLPQDCLYSLIVEEDDRREIRVIGTILDVILAPKDPQRLVEAIASPATRLVTITVTEKGYRLDPASGLLMEDEPDVRADLTSLKSPSTMPGYLAAGLRLRKDRGLPSITVASCDNMAENGSKLRAAVSRIAVAHDPALGEWIERCCAFPNSMVDRIVPATQESDVTATASTLGVIDLATVRTEPFSQWVIEQGLIGAASEIGRAGAQVTADLAPWERAKLRLLNGAHSSIAYLGGLAGIETVDEFIAKPWGERFVHILWDEVQPTLEPPPELDLAQYRRALIRRFANRALGHRLRQIAMDGSQKIPQRLLASASELTARGAAPRAIALAIAAWMRWQGGRTDAGEVFEVEDPLASTTARLFGGAKDPRDCARALFSLTSIFSQRLSNDPQFVALVADHLEALDRLGAKATLERFVARHPITSSAK